MRFFHSWPGRRWALILLALIGLPAGAIGADEPARQALAVIHDGTEELLSSLARERERLLEDPARGQELVSATITPYVDFDTIARLLLGRHWRDSSAHQQQTFIAEFRQMLTRSYASALIEFILRRGLSHADIEYLTPTATRDGRRVLVRTRLRTRSGPPLSIHYSMRLSQGDWKIYDVAVDAVSLVSTYRSSFNQEIQRHGIDGLIARLAQRNG